MLLFFHFNFGNGTDVDNGNTSGEFGEAFLEFFLVVVGRGFVNLCLDLGNAVLDVLALAASVDDGGVVLVNLDALGFTELGNVGVFELETEFFGNHFTAGKDGDVFEHGFAAVAETGSLDRTGLECSAEAVYHEGGKRFAVNIFGNDEQGASGLRDFLEQGKHVLHVGNFLVVDENVGILEDRFHPVAVGYEVGRDIPAVELHTFNEIGGGIHGLGFFNGDNAVLADLFDCVCQDLSDFLVVVGGNGRDMRYFVRSLDFLGILADLFHRDGDCFVHAPLQFDRGHAGGNRLETFSNHRIGKYGCGGSTVTGNVVGLCRYFLEELSSHVLIGILKFNFFRDGNTVFGHGRGTEFFVDEDISALRTQGNLYCAGNLFHTRQ